MPSKWNDDKLRRMYDQIRERAIKDGIPNEEMSTHYLDRLSHQTKSPRIIRMIRIAYYLGWLRGIAYVDEMQTPVTLD